jgi:hypothetical protein
MPHEDGSLEAAQYLSYGNGATIHGEFQRIIVSEHHEDIMKIIEEMELRLVGLPSPYHFERPVPRNHSGCQNIL